MHDHWRVLHALPGDGSSGRPAIGDALVSVQQRFNTLSNLQMETYEYGIPPIYADSEVLDFDSCKTRQPNRERTIRLVQSRASLWRQGSFSRRRRKSRRI